VIQNGRIINFVEGDYTYAVPAPGQELAGLFALPASFDPLKPWRLEILVNGTGTKPVSIPFGVDYKVPDSYVVKPGSAPQAQPAAAQPTPNGKSGRAQIDHRLHLRLRVRVPGAEHEAVGVRLAVSRPHVGRL
jgi:transcriptional regulator of nitric oxide reductase